MAVSTCLTSWLYSGSSGKSLTGSARLLDRPRDPNNGAFSFSVEGPGKSDSDSLSKKYVGENKKNILSIY